MGKNPDGSRVCVLLVMTVTVMTACGRKNGNNMTTAPDTGNAGAGTTMESRTDGTNQSTNVPSQTAGESGGVLRDMVDDVGDGINNLTDDVTGMSGTHRGGSGEQRAGDNPGRLRGNAKPLQYTSVPCPCAATCFCRCPAFRTGMSGTNATVSWRHFPAGKFRRVQECEIPQYDLAGHFSVEKMREKRYNKNAY